MSSTGERVVAGRYRLRRRLGQGAMGTVWEAFDEFLRRPVAVKEVLLPPGMPDEQAAELRERTLREARAIAALSHPNVVTLHDVAREDGEPFVVMEFVHAHSLAALIDVLGPLPADKAAAIADAVAAGLAAAHQVGITHRDVKPGNVLIGVDGRVKLTDFGIARNVAERTLTSTGIMLGSPAYISPEVAAGREVTPAADLWGLGATLFAMIEGRPPYDVNGPVLATVNQVVHGDVPRPDTGGPLDEIVAALMVKEPDQRISLREVRNRLHPLLPPPSTPLLTDEELARVNEAVEQAAPPADAPAEAEDVDLTDQGDTPVESPPAPVEPAGPALLAADPGALPPSLAAAVPARAGALASAPGPLPFDKTVNTKVPRVRGGLATGVVAFLAVVLFFGAAGGGFALSRYVAGQPLLPPAKDVNSSNTTTSKPPQQDRLVPRTGNAATYKGAQGGGFEVPVPAGWVEFVEEIGDDPLGVSTQLYYLSPDGTQMLTVERWFGYYPKHNIKDYLNRLESQEPAVSIQFAGKPLDTSGIPSNGAPVPEQAVQVNYRATTNAKAVAPKDKNALDQNRSTVAKLMPFAGDLWVVSLTVPIEQEEYASGLFGQIADGFKVTG